MKLKLIASIIFLLTLVFTHAQKIKYKDLYPQLASKNYEEAIPQLKQYLANEKNTEEANANLQMGLWLEDRFLKYDVVSDSSQLYEVGDSAVFYLEKAKVLITEKELKKNDDYYQTFFRRDLRTGEFGIKVSDVHLDIEKKVEAIETRISNVRKLHSKVVVIEQNQKDARNVYKELTSQFDSYNAMLIAADADIQSKLSSLEESGGIAVENAKLIKELSEKLKTDKYSQDLMLKTVKEFGVDGMEGADLRSGTIEIWNFEEWARGAQSEIIGGIGLFKTMIKKYSQEIREKKAKVKRSEDIEVGDMPEELTSEFDKYDPKSTVEKLLIVETYEVKVMKQVDLQLNPALMDSSLIGPQLEIYSNALKDVKEMNLIVESVTSDDLEQAKKKYKDYIDSFFKSYVTASKYVQEMQEWSRRNKKWLEKSVEYWSELDRWGTAKEDEEKKYPLYEMDTPESGYMTIKVPVKTAQEALAYGADLNAKKGFIGSFGPDRVEQWLLSFDLPGTEGIKYKSDSIPTIAGSESFYIYNTSASKNNFVVVSYTLEGKLNWGTVVTINKEPVDFKFDDLTQELTILLYPEEDLPLDSNELGYVVIDRTGNAR